MHERNTNQKKFSKKVMLLNYTSLSIKLTYLMFGLWKAHKLSPFSDERSEMDDNIIKTLTCFHIPILS